MLKNSIRRSVEYAKLAKDALNVRWSRDDKSREAAQRIVAQRLGKLRGLPQKVGQMMAFSADDSRRDAFGTLFEGAEPLPWKTMRPILEAAWGIDPETLFKTIDTTGRAASLGQVHAAERDNGSRVAIKIQYPGIREAVLADLKGLGWLASPFGNLNRGFDLEGYRKTILEGLEEELDYRREAINQRKFAAGPGSERHIIVPRVDEHLSCGHVLVSEWVDGDSWDNVLAKWKNDDKQDLGKRLLEWFLASVFKHGLVHADLHPGNVRFLAQPDGPKIVLYDFGSIYRMSEAERSKLLQLLEAPHDRSEHLLSLLVGLGFHHDYLEPLSDRLPALCRILCEPFAVDRPYDLRTWDLSQRINALLGDDRMNFRIAGPPRMLYLLRSFHAMITYVKGLGAKLAWRKMLAPYVTQNRQSIAALDLSQKDMAKTPTLAKYVKVQVKRNGQLKASVTMPATAIDRLESLLDPETLERIEREQLNLEAIVQDARRRGYAPGPVFELQDVSRDVKVWLE